MKKSLLTLGAVVAIAAGASAQGYLNLGTSSAGFDTVSSNPSDSGVGGTYSDWPTGTITLEIFTISATGNAALATSIDTLAGSASTEAQAITDVTGGGDGFTQQAFGPQGGGTAGELESQNLGITGGYFNASAAAINIVGTSGSVPASPMFYALYATYVSGSTHYAGVLVLDNPTTGYGPGSLTQPSTMTSDWNQGQNLLLAPVPEPATLALAGLGGLSMLFLRRRKA